MASSPHSEITPGTVAKIRAEEGRVVLIGTSLSHVNGKLITRVQLSRYSRRGA